MRLLSAYFRNPVQPAVFGATSLLTSKRSLAIDTITFGEKEPEEKKLSQRAQQFFEAVEANPAFPRKSLPFLRILLSEGFWFNSSGDPSKQIKHPARLSKQRGQDKSAITQNIKRWHKAYWLVEDKQHPQHYWLHDSLKQYTAPPPPAVPKIIWPAQQSRADLPSDLKNYLTAALFDFSLNANALKFLEDLVLAGLTPDKSLAFPTNPGFQRRHHTNQNVLKDYLIPHQDSAGYSLNPAPSVMKTTTFKFYQDTQGELRHLIDQALEDNQLTLLEKRVLLCLVSSMGLNFETYKTFRHAELAETLHAPTQHIYPALETLRQAGYLEAWPAGYFSGKNGAVKEYSLWAPNTVLGDLLLQKNPPFTFSEIYKIYRRITNPNYGEGRSFQDLLKALQYPKKPAPNDAVKLRKILTFLQRMHLIGKTSEHPTHYQPSTDPRNLLFQKAYTDPALRAPQHFRDFWGDSSSLCETNGAKVLALLLFCGIDQKPLPTAALRLLRDVANGPLANRPKQQKFSPWAFQYALDCLVKKRYLQVNKTEGCLQLKPLPTSDQEIVAPVSTGAEV